MNIAQHSISGGSRVGVIVTAGVGMGGGVPLPSWKEYTNKIIPKYMSSERL